MTNEQVLAEVLKAYDSVVLTARGEVENIVSHKPNKIESVKIEIVINNRDVPKVYITEKCYGEPVFSVCFSDYNAETERRKKDV